jgi:LPXTG-motif cell wall-anchored protein
MLKKLVAVIAAAVMVLAMGVTAFADNESPIVGQDGWLVPTAYADGDCTDADVNALCLGINAGTKSVSDISGCPAGAVQVSPMYDVKPEGNVKFPAQVTVNAPWLTDEYVNVRAMHYDTVAKVWEVIPADKVDYTGKTASFTLQNNASPLIVIADKKASPSPSPAPSPAPGGKTTPGGKTSPATGSSTNAAVFAVLAGVLAVAAVGFAMRKRNA